MLSSQGNDWFSAMTRVSVASLRATNPGVWITIACDAISRKLLEDAADPLIDEADEFLGFYTPNGSPSFRNRHIKTRIRILVGGQFLFLDSDTLIRGDLTPVFALTTDVAAARNLSKEKLSAQIVGGDAEILREMNWKWPSEVYVNGGILLFNDTPGAHAFAKRWHERWKENVSQIGDFRDQPALNVALTDVRPDLSIMPDQFNAQVKTNVQSARSAVIWHLFNTSEDCGICEFDHRVDEVVRGRGLNEQRLRAMLDRAHPWRRSTILDDLVACLVEKRGRLGSVDMTWFQGKRITAGWLLVKLAMKTLVKRVGRSSA